MSVEYFSLAPFIGALLSLVMFKDVITLQLVAAGMLMALGLHLAERHEHEHVHDEHHQHAHAGPVIEPHSHWHRHLPMRHTHRHYPTCTIATDTGERSLRGQRRTS